MTIQGGRKRCPWVAGGNDLYLRYHDEEWGVPVHDDRRHFEFLILEAAQAGLSWSIVLNKRAGYRRAFADFDPGRVARFTARRVEKLLQDASIIRNRLKIEATIDNARAFLKLQREFGSFDAYVWRFVGGQPLQHRRRTSRDVPVTSAESDVLSKDLKQRGFRFVGSTIIYAHMQAIGMVNDHLVSCFRHKEVPGMTYMTYPDAQTLRHRSRQVLDKSYKSYPAPTLAPARSIRRRSRDGH